MDTNPELRTLISTNTPIRRPIWRPFTLILKVVWTPWRRRRTLASITTILAGYLEGILLFRAKRKMKLCTFKMDLAYLYRLYSSNNNRNEKQCIHSSKDPITLHCPLYSKNNSIGCAQIQFYFDYYDIIQQKCTYINKNNSLVSTMVIYRQLSQLSMYR